MQDYNKVLTYEELCELFNEQPDYNHKGRQLSRYKQKYDIIQPSKKEFIIKHKYSLLEEIRNMESDYGKNKLFLEPIIYTILSNEKDNVVRYSMPKLLELFMLVNPDFNYARYNSTKVDLFLFGKMDGVVKNFTYETNFILQELVKRVFEDMESQYLIAVKKIKMYAISYFDSESKEERTKIYEMSGDMYSKYLEIKNRIMVADFGVEDGKDLRWRDRTILEEMASKELGVNFTFYDYEIVLNKNGIDDKIVRSEFGGFKEEFNKYIQKKIKKSGRGRLKNMDGTKMDICLGALIDTGGGYLDIKGAIKKEDELIKKEGN